MKKIRIRQIRKQPKNTLSGCMLIKRRIFCSGLYQAGYTLVETLVAIALLLSVLIPGLLFVGRLTGNMQSRNLITASGLAMEAMERALLYDNPQNGKDTYDIQGRCWTVERRVDNVYGLASIVVSIYLADKNQAVIEYKTVKVCGQ